MTELEQPEPGQPELRAPTPWAPTARANLVAAIARAAVLAIARSARGGNGTSRDGEPSQDGASLTIHEPDGHIIQIGTHAPGPNRVIRVRDPRVYAAALARGSNGLAESYARGWWDSPDVASTVRALLRLTAPLRERLDRAGRGPAARAIAAARSRGAPGAATDRHNIASHYDLSNELFAFMLDPTMTYSCAVFEDTDTTLEQAQLAKIDRLATKLGLTSADHVVEIGTGWGALAARLADTVGCRVTTTTISEAQRSFAADRICRLGLEDRVSVLGEHYRDLRGTYDAVVSVEMIEAVDWRHHNEFFAACCRLLRPTGRMALQAITMADQSFERAKQHQDFIRRMIFPGGCIPSIASIAASVARTDDLRIVDVEDLGPHYAETLRRWGRNFDDHASEITGLGFDERFRRLWRLYLGYCEAAFDERHISDVQMVLARPGWTPSMGVRPC